MSTRSQRGARGAALALVSTQRQDGWTTARQLAFLQALAGTHCVSAAAARVGMARQSAYRLRARLRGQPFDLAWDAAFRLSFDRLAEAAMERALNGVEEPVFYKGEQVGVRRRFDERLTVALLSMRDGFIRPPASPLREAGGYEFEDFRALLRRIEIGPDTWQGSEHDDTEWPGDDEADDIADAQV